MKTEDREFTPPYAVTWTTFLNTVEKMQREGIPNRIDRSYLGSQAGTTQTYLIAAFKDFELVSESGKPAEALTDFVSDEEGRPKRVRELLERHYPEIVALGTGPATQAQLEEKFAEVWGQRGATKVKAIRFYLAAAAYAGVQISPLWKAARASTSGPRKPRTKREHNAGAGVTLLPPATPSGTTRSVDLASGGTVTLTVSVDLFDLNEKDRNFVLDFIDKLKGYGAQRALEPGPAAEASAEDADSTEESAEE